MKEEEMFQRLEQYTQSTQTDGQACPDTLMYRLKDLQIFKMTLSIREIKNLDILFTLCKGSNIVV